MWSILLFEGVQGIVPQQRGEKKQDHILKLCLALESLFTRRKQQFEQQNLGAVPRELEARLAANVFLRGSLSRFQARLVDVVSGRTIAPFGDVPKNIVAVVPFDVVVTLLPDAPVFTHDKGIKNPIVSLSCEASDLNDLFPATEEDLKSDTLQHPVFGHTLS